MFREESSELNDPLPYHNNNNNNFLDNHDNVESGTTRGWRDEFHHIDDGGEGSREIPNGGEGSRGFPLPDEVRNIEDHGGWGPPESGGGGLFRPDHQTSSFWDESR